MKHLSKWLVMILLLAVFSGYCSASAVDREAIRAIQEINKIRNAKSLPPLLANDKLEEAAATHSRYMNYSNVLSSIEEAGKTYYRGRYPWDRAAYAGYDKGYITEMIGKDFNNFSQGWKRFLGDPYLRYQLLNPNYTDVGIDRYVDYSTYLLGGAQTDGVYEVIYPYHQQTNVPVNTLYYFAKNPYEQAQKEGFQGFPLTYTYYGDKKVERFDIETISLMRLNTYQNVPLTYLTNSLDNTLMILPLSSFEYFSSYELRLKMTLVFADGKTQTVNRTTRFTTESFDANKKPENVRYLTRVEFVKKLLQSLKYEVKNNLGIIFKDVNPSSADYKYVYTAYAENLVLGTPSGEFLPNANIREQDVYVILIRAYEKKKRPILLTLQDSLPFRNDVKDEYVVDPLRKAVKIGLIDVGRRSFDPNHYLSVEEFDQILKRFEEVVK